MKFEFDNNIPIYIQLVEQLKIYIISGEIPLGSKLLSVRDFALLAKVNPNTMQKALTELEELKLIYTKRTSGKYVTDDKEIIESYRNMYATDLTNKYLQNMRILGFNKEETMLYIKEFGGDKKWNC